MEKVQERMGGNELEIANTDNSSENYCCKKEQKNRWVSRKECGSSLLSYDEQKYSSF